MEEGAAFLFAKRYAVVTGANKGIGFEVCKQLASQGVMVVLTARDKKKGTEALEKLKGYGLSELVAFHQLDVSDSTSVASLADFIRIHFGKLDILVNNAGITGLKLDSALDRAIQNDEQNSKYNLTQPYEMAKACIETNYCGTKKMVEALTPLLLLSDSPRIVNISSSTGKLKNIPNEWAKGVFLDDQSLTEGRIDEVLNKFLRDFENGEIESKSWPVNWSAYSMSKAAINAYTKILAKKHSNFLVNSLCPGYVKTDMTFNTGILTVEEGAENVVRLALLPKEGPSGLFFSQKEVSPL